jgi:hypothetical protein
MKNKTYIYCILDKSGSMERILDDSIGGFNNFLTGQKEVPSECDMSIRLFDNTTEELVKHKNLQEVEPLTRQTYRIGGSTALYDAIGLSIDELGEYLASLDESERPEKVLIVILTDGQENSSRKYTYSQIREMINHQTEVYNWDFIFLAANQDALVVAETLSISRGNALNFEANSMGTTSLYDSLSMTTANYRSKDLSKVSKMALFSEAGIDNTKKAE